MSHERERPLPVGCPGAGQIGVGGQFQCPVYTDLLLARKVRGKWRPEHELTGEQQLVVVRGCIKANGDRRICIPRIDQVLVS